LGLAENSLDFLRVPLGEEDALPVPDIQQAEGFKGDKAFPQKGPGGAEQSGKLPFRRQLAPGHHVPL
jgi:hypothetical protein